MKIYPILIDPAARTVTRAEIEGGDTLRGMYRLMQCSLVEAIVYLNPQNDCLMGDEEALFKSGQRFFTMSGFPQPIAGRCLIVGTDDEGDTVTPSVSVERVAANVQWVGNAKAVEEFNENLDRNTAAAHIRNQQGGAFVIVASPRLELDDDGEVIAS